MYLWLFVVVFVIWAWLTASSVAAVRQRWTDGFTASGAIVVWTGLAIAAVLFIGPYWLAVYQILLQP